MVGVAERVAVPIPSSLDAGAQAARDAQEAWARRDIHSRLRILKQARHLMSGRVDAFCVAISPELARTPADTRVAEILPLLDASRFLERSASSILRTRRLGRAGLPVWLSGVDSQVQRVAFGQILILGPANYPLLLPGVQTLQALAAGNSVVWKPGRDGRAVAEIFCAAMLEAGLPRELLTVTDDSAGAGRDALAGRVNGVRPDKVVFTGSVEVGREVLHALAETATPCVMELSGCDAVVVLPSADIARVVQALRFGVALNGSATCMAPRRLFLLGLQMERRDESVKLLRESFSGMDAVRVSREVGFRVRELVEDAETLGGVVHGGFAADDVRGGWMRPVLVTNASADMQIAQTSISAPVLSVIEVADEASLLEGDRLCPYGLTLAIFGDEREARSLGARFLVGTLLINDVIVPTVDPRVSFGGRRSSGFGATRGQEGLLEMTAAKTVLVRRGRSRRHYEATGSEHEGLFDGLILAAHAKTWGARWSGVRAIVSSLRRLK